MNFIKNLNLFQPQKAKKININDTIACLNDDGTLYGICGAIDSKTGFKVID